MKFRIKGENICGQIVVEFDSETVTVAELKLRICEIFQLDGNEELLRKLHLSMNGKQKLITQDEELLTSLGFVSGDVIYVMGLNLDVETPTKCAKLAGVSETSLNSQESTSATASHSNTQPNDGKQVAEVASSQDAAKPNQNDPMSSVGYRGCHVPLSDTPDSLAPESYTKLVTAYPSRFETTLEKVAGLVHILMIETGFLLPQTSSSTDPFCTLPDSWNFQYEYLRVDYKTYSEGKCHIGITTAIPFIMVHGVAGVKAITYTVKPEDVISPLSGIPVGGKLLKKFAVEFKNDLAFPLYFYIQPEVDRTCPAHLLNLPIEISSKILERLDFKSLVRVGRTCRVFHDLASDRKLWKRLFKRDFGQKFGKHEALEFPDWRKLYKEEYIEAQKQEKAARSLQNLRPPFHRPPPFFPTPNVFPDYGGFGGPEFPGIVGGYSDLYPDLRGFGPPRGQDPLNRGINFPQPFGRRPNGRGFPPFGGRHRDFPPF